MRWNEVRLSENAILLGAERVKTREGRRVALGVSPSIAKLFEQLRERNGKSPLVFPEWAAGNLAKSTRGRLRRFGAPPGWTYQAIRRTCSTVLTNMRAVGPWVSSKRCGHSVVVAERSYAGLLAIPDEATTIESALGIEHLAGAIVAAVSGAEQAPGTDCTA